MSENAFVGKDYFEFVKGQVEEKDAEIEELKLELQRKEAHIEVLLEVEREYENVKKSRTYRLAKKMSGICDKIIPYYSKRRFVLSLCLKCVRHPVRMLRKFSIQRVRNMFKELNRDGVEAVNQHLSEMIKGTEIYNRELVLEEIKHIDSLDECEILEFPVFENPMVSIVIPVYNQFSFTYACLQSILKNTDDVSYEIIIGDDGSDDLTVDIEKVVKNIQIQKTEKNVRFLRNCNNAAKYAKGKYIFFLNNDTKVQKEWLSSLVKLIENDSTIGMVGSKLVYADGRLQEAGGIIWNDGSGWNYGNRKDPNFPEYNYVKDVDYISGAAIMIRKTLWTEIGGFDELFAPAYCEDSDLAFAVRKKGYRVVYQPKSVIVHYEGISNGTDLNSGVKQYQVDNTRKLFEKWKVEMQAQAEKETELFTARDRSMGKKTVLFIDHYVPTYDQDAGSKTIFQYLKMFVSKGYSVKFVGDNFYQSEPYTSVLQQMGIEVLYGSYYAKNILKWIKENQKNIDVVLLNRPHISIKYIDFLKNETDLKLIYYGHDLHFLRIRREYELTGDKKKIKESEEWKEKELYLMRNVSMSYYPSYVEEETIHAIDEDIRVKAITAYVFDKFKDNIQSDFSKREGIMFVGGFGHDPNLDAVQWFVKEIWPIVHEKLKIPFYIIGSHAPLAVNELDGKNGIVVKGFVTEEELGEMYAKCRISVVPLRYGAGVKGKVVEAIYNGIPVVTTSVGAEGIQNANVVLQIEDEPERFANAVIELYGNTEKMAEVSEKMQEFVRQYFSIDAVWKKIEEDF